MKGFLTLLVILVLFGCSMEEIKPEWNGNRTTTITWVVLKDLREADIICQEKLKKIGPWLGCASPNYTTSATIYAVMPEYVNDEFTLIFGHEILHAFLGKYHK